MEFKDIQIIRSRRRTIALQIEENGRVTLRAPERASEQMMRMFVQEKSSWLERNVMKQEAAYAKRPRRRFEHGEMFLYVGAELPLLVEAPPLNKGRWGGVSNRKPFEVSDAFYLCETAKHRAESIMKRWYKSRARFLFNDRAEFYAQLMNVPFENIKLSSATTRWGSCGAGNTLNFNWRLIMAPMVVIDSVVVHELAHCRYKHHGKPFWSFVERHCPDYDVHDRWLKENGPRLHWD